jgi:hypothetical protein
MKEKPRRRAGLLETDGHQADHQNITRQSLQQFSPPKQHRSCRRHNLHLPQPCPIIDEIGVDSLSLAVRP